ncbi:MAG: energy transducer TonB [Alphaproteobacteria bacterium]
MRVSRFIPESRRSGAISLAVSFAIHAGLILWASLGLTSQEPAPASETTPRPMEISLVVLEDTLIPAPQETKPLSVKTPVPPETPKPKAPSRPVPQPQFVQSAPQKPVENSAPSEGLSSPQVSAMPAAENTPSAPLQDKADYFAKLRAWVEKHKSYPRAARRDHIEGDALVLFTMNQTGVVLSSHIVKSSGYVTLDEAALGAVRDASPLPPMPDTLPQQQLVITVPFGFHLE